MVNDKRGISPLISTILIIGFGVILFLLISSWVQKGIVKESIEKSEEQIGKQFECSGVGIEVDDACVGNKVGAKEMKLNVDVTGYDAVKGLFIRVVGGDGGVGVIDYTSSKEVSSPNRLISASEILAIKDQDGNFTTINNVNKIEIYPKSADENICNDQVEVVDDIKNC